MAVSRMSKRLGASFWAVATHQREISEHKLQAPQPVGSSGALNLGLINWGLLLICTEHLQWAKYWL